MSAEIRVTDECSFDSIVSLFNLQKRSGKEYLPKNVAVDDRGQEPCVSDGSRIFKLGAQRAASQDHGSMTANGGSWFGVFRGEKVDNGLAEWNSLVADVASNFHAKYQLMSCFHPAQVEKKDYQKAIEKAIGECIPQLSGKCSVSQPKNKTMKFFVVGTRITPTDNGEPFLGKLFFRSDGTDFKPVRAENCTEIIGFLDTIKGGDSANGFSETMRTGIVTAWEKVLRSKDGFGDYLYLREQDQKVIRRITKQQANSEKVVTCRDVKLLSVIYVDWAYCAYDVYFGRERILEADLGVGNKLSLRCTACGAEDNLLVDKGVPNRAGIAKHLKEISCDGVGLNGQKCVRYVCDANRIKVDDTANELCKDCPHIEMLYEYGDVKHLTSNMVYAVDVNGLIPEEDAKLCKLCRRPVKNTDGNGRCGICSCFYSRDEAERKNMHERYKKYANMLSWKQRAYLGTEKYCVEDAFVVLFSVGERTYKFDKDDLNAGGYVKSPEAVQKAGRR